MREQEIPTEYGGSARGGFTDPEGNPRELDVEERAQVMRSAGMRDEALPPGFDAAQRVN